MNQNVNSAKEGCDLSVEKSIFGRMVNARAIRLLVLDPAIARSRSQSLQAATSAAVAREGEHANLAVPVTVKQECWQRIRDHRPSAHLLYGDNDVVAFFQEDPAMPKRAPPRLHFLGWHGTDSGLSCIVPSPLYDQDGPPREDVAKSMSDELFDWREFVMMTLSQPDLSAFKSLLWFGRVPAGGTAMAVYGLSHRLSTPEDDGEETVYDGLLLRAYPSESP